MSSVNVEMMVETFYRDEPDRKYLIEHLSEDGKHCVSNYNGHSKVIGDGGEILISRFANQITIYKINDFVKEFLTFI